MIPMTLLRSRTLLMIGVVMLAAATCSAASRKGEELAREIRIDVCNFQDATLQEAVDYLDRKTQEQVPKGRKLRVFSNVATGARITFAFRDKPLFDLLQEIAKQTTVLLKVTDESIYFGVPGEPVPVQTKDRQHEEGGICEAFFRYAFSVCEPVAEGGFAGYFISINGQDPSDIFMARFAKHNPPVKKVSDSNRGKSGEVIDKATKKMGVIVSLDGIDWLSDEKVKIACGSFGCEYEITHTTKGWFITKLIPGPIFDPVPTK